MKIRLLFLFIIFSATNLSAQTGITGAISVNDGATITNNPEKVVNLNISANGATHMMISNDGSFVGRRWEPYSTRRQNWRLAGEDGRKVVYAKFRDGGGNVSEVVSAEIELDRTPPLEPSILINGGIQYTNNKSRTVVLELHAQEAHAMRISNRGDFLGAKWVPFREKVTGWRLTGADGTKEVFVQYKDLAGNTTETISSRIVLDMIPPTRCKMIVADGQRIINSKKVRIRLLAEGAHEMIIRGGEGWVPYKEEIEWELIGGDGEKVIYAKFRDAVGNESVVVSGRVILDTKPPSLGMIVINNGSRYTNQQDVQLKMIAKGATHMVISNTEEFKNDWRPYSPVVPNWLLDPQDGTKTVYIKYRDHASNESKVFNDKIVLDRTPPKRPFIRISSPDAVYDSIMGATLLSNDAKIVDLVIKAEDADYMMISNISTFYGAQWEVYQPVKKNWELGGNNDGDRSVFIKFRDKAGNISEVAFDKIIIDTQAPVGGKISINNNAEFCTDQERKVMLQLFCRGATLMKVSNDATFADAEWEPYQTTKPWVLSDEDGLKSVLVKYNDAAGNESEPVIDNVILDRKPPFATSIVVNKGEEMTNHPDKVVLVKVRAEDAKLMQISNSEDFSHSRWRGYSNLNFNWTLGGDDGDKKVFVRFKDEAGNISEPVFDDIKLDRSPPKEGSIKINEGEGITNNANKKVLLSLYAESVTEMMISNRMDFKDAKWEPFNETKDWVLYGPDGLKTVYAKFRDKIGNESRIAIARIGVDRQAPKEGRITVNGGAKYCTNVNGYVNLKLYAQEAKEMMISNNSTFDGADWIKYDYFYQNWMLDDEDGDKKVYVKFRDEAENETTPIVANIILDRQEPVGEDIVIDNGASFTNNKSNRVKLEVKAEGAVEMMVSNSHFFRPPAKWEPYRESLAWTLTGRDGEKAVYVKFRDIAGNESSVATSKIRLDTEPPIPQYMKINDGKTSTDDPRVTLTIKARNANYMMISNNPKFEGAIWEPYALTKEWNLSEGEGLKRLFVKFKDDAQNESGHIFADVTLYTNY
ncbi:hypothetical protein AAG747_25690 [Rapidithrix thailandica]|uniref:Ig-like domain-containing protein n=1 Tax=Rapidithrix thailandica TaxID=413964 RepID=A0AAW9SKG4_9BACT